MANRSYLYSLSNRPSTYVDRPETISGLSEWPYDVPFVYRVLMSGDPQLCASLISDGLDDEDEFEDNDLDDPPIRPMRLHAVSGDFESGFARLTKLFAIARQLVAGKSPKLVAQMDATVAFLEAHRDRYLLLETLELDTMTEDEEDALRVLVEQEVESCRAVGAAIDALPADVKMACAQLESFLRAKSRPPFDVFHGLRLDDDFDNVRGKKTKRPLGISEWSDVLYLALWNRAEFDANR